MNVSEKQPKSIRRTTRRRRVPRKPSWEIPACLVGNKKELSPQPQKSVSGKFIKDTEGICHHCRKCKDKKNLVP